jgi:amidohydrolase
MALDPTLTDRIEAAIAAHHELLDAVALEIHANPELRFEERHALATIRGALARAGHREVTTGIGGLPTAFRTRVGPAGGGRVALLAEYDALPEVGHACGHNLIAAAALGAFLGLAALGDDLPGSVELIGTPGEERGGGKRILLEAGVFEGLDAALMFHPLDRDLLAHGSLASDWVEVQFTGVPAHAAVNPWDGSSALAALIATFTLVDQQRLHCPDGSRIHGYITDGGQAVNIIPERAAGEFSVRAHTTPQLADVRERVIRCARAAAAAHGVEVHLRVQPGYAEMWNNRALLEILDGHLRRLGRPAAPDDPELGLGSTDLGNVSQRLPAIHPYLAICDPEAAICHQHAFATHAGSDRGLATARLAAAALAATALELLVDPALRAAAWADRPYPGR